MARPYKPISSYAAIGNLRIVALVGRDGSIDWAPFPNIGSPSVFSAILDARRGGSFCIAPPGGGTGEQRYIPDTNVIQTRFLAGQGSLTVTDFMPLSGSLRGTDRSSARLRRSTASSPVPGETWTRRSSRSPTSWSRSWQG